MSTIRTYWVLGCQELGIGFLGIVRTLVPDPERVATAKVQSEMSQAAEQTLLPMPQLYRQMRKWSGLLPALRAEFR